MRTITERAGRTLRLALILSALGLALASVALAHPQDRQSDREIVRLQGYRERRPQGVEIVGEMDFGILGDEHKFHLTARQTFGPTAAAEPPPARLLLQGDREMLAKIAAARPEQRVTILGERRPGGLDLFLLAVDFCPEK